MLNKLMAERDITKSQLAQYSGIPYTTIDGWYKKGYENVRLATLLKLAEYFNVTLDYLVGRTGNGKINGLTETEVMKHYGQLDLHGRRVVDFIIGEEIERIRSEAGLRISKLPDDSEI